MDRIVRRFRRTWRQLITASGNQAPPPSGHAAVTNGRQVCAQGHEIAPSRDLLMRASAAPSGGGVLTDSVLSSGVIVASPEELAVNMLLAAWYW